MDAQSTSFSQGFGDCVCRICAQTNGHEKLNIFDNFLIYKKLHVSFLEIIKDVLDLDVTNQRLQLQFQIDKLCYLSR